MPYDVLIVDDSAIVRQCLSDVLDSDPELQVVGTASDPFVAAERLKKIVPDVITLDVEMPRMDGITFLKKLMSQHPIPVVMCSSLTEKNSDTALEAMELGAIDIIEKPRNGTANFLEDNRIRICDAVKAAAIAGRKPRVTRSNAIKPEPKLSPDAVIKPKKSASAMTQTTEKVLVIGASTGGTEALRILLESFPLGSPGTVVVQHMPERFTSSFAERLNSICAITVKEANHRDLVLPGQVLIAPGNKHCMIKRSGAQYYVEIKNGPLVSRHRPSVDVLFRSAANYVGQNAVGIIMTGMGDDGATGMKELHSAGAKTIAQDEQTSVVFGMPQEAIKKGGVDFVLPLGHIASKAISLCS